VRQRDAQRQSRAERIDRPLAVCLQNLAVQSRECARPVHAQIATKRTG
jgi:hypothetical protein